MTDFRPASSTHTPEQLYALVQASRLGCQLVAVQQRLQCPMYLVGGCVRDWLLGKNPGDWDVVLPGSPHPVLEALQASFGRRPLIELDATLEIYRIQFEAGTYLDVARLSRDDLLIDLERRDLTINAMAVDLGSGELIDPLGGYQDLQSRVLRVPQFANLKADPARALRVYRFAATLGFHPLPETTSWLRQTASSMRSVAGERLLAEWHKLLSSGRAAPTLADMEAAGTLGWALGAPGYQTRGCIERIAAMEHLDEVPTTEAQKRLSNALEADISDERPRKATFILAALLLDAAVTERATIVERLRLSRRQTDLITSILESYRSYVLERSAQFDPLGCFRGIRDTRDAWLGLMWLLTGDVSETIRQSAQQGLTHYWLLQDHPPPQLVSGHDILALPGVKPGPEVARRLEQVNEAIALGLLKTREEALDWLKDQEPQKM